MKHNLIQEETEKLINLSLVGTKLISETGKAEKMKTTEKEFSSDEDALKAFTKKEWESLKKGFVLRNENPRQGEAFLHYFVGGGYTGALSFQHSPKGIFVYKNDVKKDFLELLDSFGNVLQEIELPKILAWNIEYRSETDSLLLDLDHHIFEYKIEDNSFSLLGKGQRSWTSFVSVAKEKTAFAMDKKFFIIDKLNNVLLSQDYKVETIAGTTAFCAKLSDDGSLLAFHNKKGEVQIINTANGAILSTIIGGFHSIDQMEFADNNNMPVVRDEYGTWRVHYFELSTSKEIEMKNLEIPNYSKDVHTFCFNADQSKLANNYVDIYCKMVENKLNEI